MVLFALSCYGITSAQRVLTKQEFLSDLQLYSNTMRMLHPAPAPAIDEAGLNALWEAMQVESEITYERALVELLALNAMMEDEHTIIYPVSAYVLPFDLQVFDDGVAIIATDSVHAHLRLSAVLAIEGMAIDQVMERFQRLAPIKRSSYFDLFLKLYIDSPEILIGLGVIQELDAIDLRLQKLNGDTVDVTVSAYSALERGELRNAGAVNELLAYSGSRNYWAVHVEEQNAVYFNYQRCREDPQQSFTAFNKELFELIKETRPDKLILDLRSNSGGNSALLRPFVKAIRRSYLNDAKHFHVLIGKGTFSSAVMNAVTLKRRTKATFIGQGTGGSINAFGEIKAMKLPNTGATVTYSTKYFENWKGKEGGLLPDIEIPDLLIDFRGSHDRALQTAYEQ